MNNRPALRASDAGFSLLELLLSLVVAVEVLVAAYMAFDVSSHAAAVQTQITDLQQSLRIVQHDMSRLVRMAGRGGLPAELRPDLEFVAGATIPNLQGLAIEVRNNVTDDTGRRISRTDNDSPLALPLTDVLIVRGCFANPLYQITQGSLVLQDTDGDSLPDRATMPIPDISIINIAQPLEPVCDELRARGTATMILGSPEGRAVWGIGTVRAHDCPATGANSTLNLELQLATNSPLNPDIDPDAATISRAFPPEMDAATACMLEEYRYYVREEFEDPAVETPETLRTALVRARFEPGTENPYAGDSQNYSLPLADGIIDLQIALGFDSDFPSLSAATPGAVDDDPDFDNSNNDEVIYEAADWSERNTDDFLFNHPGDDPDSDGVVPEIRWRQRTFAGREGQLVPLRHVRITTIARTNRADRTYRAPDFDPTTGRDFVEDHDYDSPLSSEFNNEWNRKFRRRALTTVLLPRNL